MKRSPEGLTRTIHCRAVGSVSAYRPRVRTSRAYRGVIRWGPEEAFWDDIFNSAKDEPRYLEYAPEDRKTKTRKYKVFGYTVATRKKDRNLSRLFTARFGDISLI